MQRKAASRSIVLASCNLAPFHAVTPDLGTRQLFCQFCFPAMGLRDRSPVDDAPTPSKADLLCYGWQEPRLKGRKSSLQEQPLFCNPNMGKNLHSAPHLFILHALTELKMTSLNGAKQAS